jgi:hypothetical protein
VDRSEEILWSALGNKARDYLIGRGLTETTIRQARLGYWPSDEHFVGIFADRQVWVPRGIVIPWFDGADVVFINIRRPVGDPKYVAVLGSRSKSLYPSRETISVGKPLVIVEGEFDALLVGQALNDLASVVSVGGSGSKPSARVLNSMLGASPWIVAVDADVDGEELAEVWMSRSDRCTRVAPPAGMGKDWSEAHKRGLDLATWWPQTLNRISGRSVRQPEPELIPQILGPRFDDIPEGYSLVDGFLVQDPPPCPWRDPIRDWPEDWRLRWGGRANAYTHKGVPWPEDEILAAKEVAAEKEAARGGPAPVTELDTYTALQRDFLQEMMTSGEAARYLSVAEFRQAEGELMTVPLDCESLRSFVHLVMSRERAERNRALGIQEISDARRWHCGNAFCLNKSRWWMSEFGVVNCLNCCPPGSPDLVIVQGEAKEAPIVEPGRSNQARVPLPVPKSKPLVLPPDSVLTVAIVAPVSCLSHI